MKRYLLVFLFILLAIPAFSIPQQIYFQGILLTAGNTPETGTHSFIFTIYDQATGGVVEWQETHPSVTVANGLYTVKLGSINPIAPSVFDGDTRYVGIQVDTDVEMTPRVQILSVPYAYKAYTAETIAGGDAYVNVTGDTMTGTLTMAAGVIRSDVSDSPGVTAFHLITNNSIDSNADAPGFYIPTASLFSVTSGTSTSPAFSVFQSSDVYSWRGLKIPALDSGGTREFNILAGDMGQGGVFMGFLDDPSNMLLFKNDGTLEVNSETININADIDSDLKPFADDSFDLGTLSAQWRDVYAVRFHGDGTFLTGVGGGGLLTTTEADARYVNVTGDTMTGTLTNSANVTALQFISTTGGAPLVVASSDTVIDFNADLLDYYHAGNGSGQIPISNGTVNVNLNADKLDGYHATDEAGGIPISNGTVNTNLNADMLDGKHASEFVTQEAAGNLYVEKAGDTMTGVLTLSGSSGIDSAAQIASTVSTGTPPFVVASTTKVANFNADQLDGYDASNGSGDIPISDGNLNTNLNADMLDGKHASEFLTQEAAGNIYVEKAGDTMTGVLTLSGSSGIDSAAQIASTVTTGTAPFVVASTTKVANLNVDQLDGYDASNSSGDIPISNTTVNTDLNADELDGYDAGNASGNVPVSNGTVNTNLNADLLDGRHASDFVTQEAAGNLYVEKAGDTMTGVLTLSGSSGIDTAAQIASTVTTGTAPFVVASITKVANLNVDRLDDHDSSYFATSASLSDYVLKAGDTMNGSLTIESPADLYLGDRIDVSGIATFNSEVYLGDAAGDGIYFNGQVASTIEPAANFIQHLGSPSRGWKVVYARDLYGTDAYLTGTASISVSSGSDPAIRVINSTTGGGAKGVYSSMNGASSNDNYAGYFETDSTQGVGVYGLASKTGAAGPYGGYFVSAGQTGKGIYGEGSAEGTTDVNYGGQFVAKGGQGFGVHANAPSTSSNTHYGGYFLSDGSGGIGVYGSNASTGIGGKFSSSSGMGLQANGSTAGGSFEVSGSGGTAVYARATGISGSIGVNTRVSQPTGKALVATNESSGDYAELGTGSYAGAFYGDVDIQGTLSKSSGSFIIDHPLDPANKVLRHSFVESPDMKNVYDGTIVLDEKGEAVVELPNYFGVLNKDFRYQLTTIGDYAPVYIKEKIKDNQFRIAGGKSGMEVCWQITGTRQDVFALDKPIIVEEDKAVKGTYLYPEGFDKEHASIGKK
jgi:molybdopterin-binding protein